MQATKWQVMVILVSGAFLSMGVASFSSRAEAKEAAAAPVEGYASATIQDLVKSDRFKNQKVQFEAAVSKVGCVGCGGVTMADKTWRISVCPEDPSKLEIPTTAGTRVRIWGILSVVSDFREVKAQRVEVL